jgi:hypothetical protein
MGTRGVAMTRTPLGCSERLLVATGSPSSDRAGDSEWCEAAGAVDG